MSSISSVGGSQDNLYNLLQTVTGGGQNTSSTTTSLTGSSTPDAEDGGSSEAGAVSGGGHHHHHGHGGGAVQNQIESAVTSALQSAPPGSDPNDVVQSAIAQALQQFNGNGSPTNPSATGGNPTDPNAAASANPSAQGPGNFASLLQSYGISQDQFRDDFHSALQQSGASFPPGTLTDVQA